MWAVFIKEMRENAGKALLGTLVVCGILAGMLYVGQVNRQTILSDSILMTGVWCFCGAGLVLGAAQVLQDTRRGRWGFIVHRPISRWRIFAAKALAGLLLYAIVSGAGVATLIVLARQPTVVLAPFSWEMTLPLLFTQGCGAMAYCIGALVAARRAAWIGSRLFPIPVGLAIVGGTFLAGATEFTATIAAVGVGTIALAIAAAAYFVHNGSYEAQPGWIKPLQSAAVAAGVGTVVSLAIGLSISVIRQIAAFPNPIYYGNSYTINYDGKPIRTEYGRNQAYYDLAGNQLSVTSDNGFAQMETASGSLRDVANASRSEHPGTRFFSAHRYLWTLASGVHESNEAWYYVDARRTIEGYDNRGNFLGTIGPNGFAKPGEMPTPFGENFTQSIYYSDYYTSSLFTSKTHVYWLDFEKRTARKIFESTPDEPILFASHFDARPPVQRNPGDIVYHRRSIEIDNSSMYFAIATRSKIHVLQNDRQIFSRDLDYRDDTYYLSVGRASDGAFCLMYMNYTGKPDTSGEFIRVAESGQLIDRTSLPPLPQHVQDIKWIDRIPIVFLPPAMLAYLAFVRDVFGQYATMPYLISAGMLMMLSVIVTLWLCRRYGVSRLATIGWTAFAVLGGPGAAITFYFMHDRPVRVKCPSCGKPRNVRNTLCEHCGEPFPKPSMPQIDVFETPSVQAA